MDSPPRYPGHPSPIISIIVFQDNVLPLGCIHKSSWLGTTMIGSSSGHSSCQSQLFSRRGGTICRSEWNLMESNGGDLEINIFSLRRIQFAQGFAANCSLPKFLARRSFPVTSLACICRGRPCFDTVGFLAGWSSSSGSKPVLS